MKLAIQEQHPPDPNPPALGAVLSLHWLRQIDAVLMATASVSLARSPSEEAPLGDAADDLSPSWEGVAVFEIAIHPCDAVQLTHHISPIVTGVYPDMMCRGTRLHKDGLAHFLWI